MTHVPSQMPELINYEFNSLDMEVQSAFPNDRRDPLSVIIWVMKYLRQKDRLKSHTRAASVPSDKERAEALEWLNDVRFYAVAGGHDNPEDFKRRSQGPADVIYRALIAPDQSETIKQMMEILTPIMSEEFNPSRNDVKNLQLMSNPSKHAAVWSIRSIVSEALTLAEKGSIK